MYGYEALADALVAEGVEVVFTVIGSDFFHVLEELQERRGVKVIRTRHEQGAVGMAAGYARASRGPGVALVTSGPGLTNAGTSLITANRARFPVVCITTSPPPLGRSWLKRMDQRLFAEATAGRFVPVRNPDAIGQDVQTVFRHVRSGHGPAVLSVPQDALEEELSVAWGYQPSSDVMPAPQRIQPDPALIARAATILGEAERPVIVAGQGAVLSGATEEIKGLAERIGALLAASVQGKGLLDGHPFYVGFSGGFATDVAHSLISESDCVIAVGAGLNPYTTEAGLLFPHARIIQIDTDPARIGTFLPAELGIVGDARATVAVLNSHLDRIGFTSRSRYWTEDVKLRLAGWRQEEENISYVEAPDMLDPREVVRELDRLLPQDRVLAVDNGHFVPFVWSGVSVPDPANVVWTGDFSGIGQGLINGLGAALARPDAHTVIFTGDGGFLMNPQELDTAVRHHIPVTIVIMNDDAYGSEVHLLEREGRPFTFALFDNPAFADIARAFGATGLTVRNREELRACAPYLVRQDGPVVVDVKINLNVVHPFYTDSPIQHQYRV